MILQTDSELVILAACGDSDAFAELVRHYRNAVYGYCFYRTGNFEDARDLCQETFILAYSKLGQLRDAGKFGIWLRKIAANLCTRWSQRQREVPVEEVPIPQPCPESPRAAFVREALSVLPDKERLAVVMHHVDGLSYSEIAQFLEVSPAAVKGRLYRGREMLRTEVLRMTQEAFDENRLDEEFVLKSVRLALDASEKACWEQKNPQLARKKADEAIEMLDRLGNRSSETDLAKYEALMRVVHATQDLAEREESIGRAFDFGIQSGDALVAAEALRGRAEVLVWKRDLAPAQELLERAREVAGKNNLMTQLAFCDAVESEIAFIKGDTEKSKALLRQALDRLHGAQSIPGQYIARLQAGLKALDSLPSGSAALLLYCSVGHFRAETNKILLEAYPGGNLLSTADFTVSPQLPVLPNALPPFELGWPEPDQLLALPSQAGQRWCTETRELNAWYRLDSVIESDNESVITGLGEFAHCVRVVKRLSGPKRQGVDLERQIYGTRTIWFAPEVGMVKTVHEPEEGENVNAELVDYHIAGESGYLPLGVGNWWRYKWIEGKEEYGFQADNYMEITDRDKDGEFIMQRYITCVRQDL